MQNNIIIYHNGRCGKSRGALEILQELAVPHTVRWYLADPLSRKELISLLKKLHMQPSEIVRKSEDIYKEQYANKEVTEEEWLDILVEHPILIERPIVTKGRKAVIARPPERVQELL